MGWVFFILANAAFFIRPGDLAQTDLPIYNVLILACMLSAGGRALGLALEPRQSPVTACVMGVAVACVLSQLSHASLRGAFESSVEIVKIVIYYLLLITLVDSPARLRSFLRWLVFFTLILTALALAHNHGFIEIKSLDAYLQREFNPETGEIEQFPRLCSTGVFNDPNDLSMILVLAITASLFFVETGGLTGLLWLAPIGVFGYALKLTLSRGGLLNLGASLMAVSYCRLGSKKTLMLAVLAAPAMLVLFGGRMTRVDPTDTQSTSQDRIKLWVEGFNLFREAPLFGIGMNQYGERAGLVAHNSFVHTYAELGFFGGTLFAGTFYSALAGAVRLGNKDVIFFDRSLSQLRPYVVGMICSYCAGLLSLSRPYTITTYVLIGIAAAYLRLAETHSSSAGLRLDSQFVQRLFIVGVVCLIVLYLFTRYMVRWG